MGAAGAGAAEVEPVPADVDQLTGHGVGRGVDRLADGLVAAADRGQAQPSQERVDQPPPGSAGRLPAGADDAPHHEGEQHRWPHPPEPVPDGRVRPEEGDQAGDRQEHGGRRRPALRVVAEP